MYQFYNYSVISFCNLTCPVEDGKIPEKQNEIWNVFIHGRAYQRTLPKGVGKQEKHREMTNQTDMFMVRTHEGWQAMQLTFPWIFTHTRLILELLESTRLRLSESCNLILPTFHMHSFSVQLFSVLCAWGRPTLVLVESLQLPSGDVFQAQTCAVQMERHGSAWIYMHTLQKSISSVLVGVTMKIMNVCLHSYLLVQIESNSLKCTNVI